jgi:agmatine deiminase
MNGADSGWRMPAEWEPHEATWIAWPRNLSEFPGKFEPIPWAFGEIVRALAPAEKVRICVSSPGHERKARRILSRIGVSGAELFRIPTNRVWTRDFGPLFVRNSSRPALAVAGFRFNAWARYPRHGRDAQVARRISAAVGYEYLPVRRNGRDVVLEGGSIDVNGLGSILTTEECLLDQEVQVRNPGLERKDVESILGSVLGAPNVLWLGKGLAGDDTHGHVDDFCRFVGPDTVVLSRENDPRDVNYKALEENRERLEGCRCENGSRVRVVFLPMPRPLFMDGQRLPASYANFYISNTVVIVPTFNDPSDRTALGILGELFPGRAVVGIHCVDLVWGLGALHCLTQQQPVRPG